MIYHACCKEKVQNMNNQIMVSDFMNSCFKLDASICNTKVSVSTDSVIISSTFKGEEIDEGFLKWDVWGLLFEG